MAGAASAGHVGPFVSPLFWAGLILFQSGRRRRLHLQRKARGHRLRLRKRRGYNCSVTRSETVIYRRQRERDGYMRIGLLRLLPCFSWVEKSPFMWLFWKFDINLLSIFFLEQFATVSIYPLSTGKPSSVKGDVGTTVGLQKKYGAPACSNPRPRTLAPQRRPKPRAHLGRCHHRRMQAVCSSDLSPSLAAFRRGVGPSPGGGFPCVVDSSCPAAGPRSPKCTFQNGVKARIKSTRPMSAFPPL